MAFSCIGGGPREQRRVEVPGARRALYNTAPALGQLQQQPAQLAPEDSTHEDGAAATGPEPFIRLQVDFVIKNAPGGLEEFVIRDSILIDPEKASVAHIRAAAVGKLRDDAGLDASEGGAFQLFYERADDGGARYLFDTQLMDELLGEMEQRGSYRLRLLLVMRSIGANGATGTALPRNAAAAVGGAGGAEERPTTLGGVTLTEAALRSLADTGRVDPALAHPLYTVDDLAAGRGATRGTWRFRGVVRRTRRKTDRVTEVELEDARLLGGRCISAISFDAASSASLAQLEQGRTVELRNCRAAAKTAADVKFQTNNHPHKIVVDPSSTIVLTADTDLVPPRQLVVATSSGKGGGGGDGGDGAAPVRTLSLGGAAGGAGGAVVLSAVPRALPRFNGPPSLAGGIAPTLTSLPPSAAAVSDAFAGQSRNSRSGGDSGGGGSTVTGVVLPYRAGVSSGSSSNSNSAGGGGLAGATKPRRTLFVGSSSSAASCGPPRSQHSGAHAAEGSAFLSNQRTQQLQEEEVRDRHMRIAHAREEIACERIKRKTAASPLCALCGFDLTSQESLHRLRCRIEAMRERTPGYAIAPLANIERLFADLRPPSSHGAAVVASQSPPEPGPAPLRVLCNATVVNPATRRHHRVHARCAHIATQYQKGDAMSEALLHAEMSICCICGGRGAATQCYHPDCKKCFHTACAILSSVPGGFIDFGPRDPLLPKAACPAHKFIPMDRGGGKGGSGGAATTPAAAAAGGGGSGDVELFDSNVVQVGELRDPDSEGEEDEDDAR